MSLALLAIVALCNLGASLDSDKTPRIGEFCYTREVKSAFYFLIGLAFFLGCGYLFLHEPAQIHTQTITIGNTLIKVEVRDTEAGRELGLSGRNSLEKDHGMLFVFETPGPYGFWMKDMKFALDMIWISEDMRVVGVVRDAKPEDYPLIYNPRSDVKYVVEVPAGYSAEHGIDTGTKVSF